MSTPPQPEPDFGLNTEGLLREGLEAHDRGLLDQAEKHYRSVLAADPQHFVALHQLGVLENQRGHFEAAARLLTKALGLRPRSPLAHLNRGISLLNLNQPEAALSHFRWSLLADPDHVEAWLNKAKALLALGEPAQALGDLDCALDLQPQSLPAALARIHLLQSLQRHSEAVGCCDQALAHHRDDPDLLTLRGTLYQSMHQPGPGLLDHERALALSPGHAHALMNRGTALLELGRPEEALAAIDKSLQLLPGLADGHLNRGNALLQLRRIHEALAEYRQALELAPGMPAALRNRSLALHMAGKHEEAIAGLDQLLDEDPQDAIARSAKIFMLDFLPDLTFARHQEERLRYHEVLSKEHPHPLPGFENDRNPNRPLVLGYVSADFCQHSAAACFGPILRRHDHSSFRVICYSGVLTEDAQTQAFQACSQRWVPTTTLSDEALAACIRRDQVDILIDLSGHSTGNRLGVFARKPAPIQVTAWGHTGGTGLPMVDYQFTDPIHIPAEARALFAEASVDLPCCITFEAPEDAPAVSELPAARHGRITFGCLNRFSKVTPAMLERWADLLASLPGSRLLLKDGLLDDAQVQSEVLSLFQGHGIPPDRIELRGLSSRTAHLATYQEMDISLDTYPQNGGITTWESLWMGVPVVALLGGHPACRLSASILGSLGLEGWVAKDPNGYLAAARERARDLPLLAALRATLRERILASPSGNSERYTRAVEGIYRQLWQSWVRSGTS